MEKEYKNCQNCKQDFSIESEDFVFYQKIKVPAPTFCPDCREQRRIAFRNERALYKRNCDLCGLNVVSRVSSDKLYKMYCQKCWWSDKWDGLQFGKDYDFSKPFFEQFKELLFSTPHISLQSGNSVNSDWINQETDDKNCYLNVGGHYNEDSAYNTYEFESRDCFDNYWLSKSELSYENINCERCYKTLYSRECFDCQETILSSDCRGCSNIFGCAGLRNKQYYIFNQPYSKEGYFEYLKNNPITSYENVKKVKERARQIWFSTPNRFTYIFKSFNSSGHFINESKNANNCWNAEKIEDSKNLFIALGLKDTHDCSAFGWGELDYEGSSSVGLYDSKFFVYILGGGTATQMSAKELEYCYALQSSSNCFGCANMQKKQYCILNKQYTKEEYEELVPKIIQQMNDMPYVDKKGRVYKYGEFFPIEFSPFGYNETSAMDYYPLTKDQIIENGFSWSEVSENKHEFSDYKIPDDIKDVGDDILSKILKCEISGKAYKITQMELNFYRKMGIPIPRRSPLQRHKDRMAKLLPRKLVERQCCCAGAQSKKINGESAKEYKNTTAHSHGDAPCPNIFQTPYLPDRPEIIYCESCYQQEIS